LWNRQEQVQLELYRALWAGQMAVVDQNAVMPTQPDSSSDADVVAVLAGRSPARGTSRSAMASRSTGPVVITALGWLLGAFAILPVRGASIFPEARAFIEEHCADCHDGATKKAGMDLTALQYDPEDKANFAIWVKVHDRVKAGEMPPRKRQRPDPAALDSFVNGLASTLTVSEQAIIARDGRAMKRRLNRYEYENTLRDLLQVTWVQIMNRLPQDGEAYRFNKSGEALDVSHVQMARYLNVSDYAMRQAMSVQFEHPATKTNRYYAREEPSMIGNFRPRENSTLPDRFSFPVLDSHAQPDVRAGRAPLSDPATRDREAVGRVSSIFSDAGGYSWSQFRVPAAGRYRLRFSGYSIWVSGGGIGRWFFDGQGEEKAPVYHLPLWHRPNLDEVWPGRRDEPIGVYAQSAGQSRPLGELDFKPEPIVDEIEVVLAANEVIQTDGLRLFRTRVNGTDEQYVNPLAQEDGMPGYAIQWMEVEGPLYDESSGAGYRLLFGDLPMKRVEAGQPGVALEVGAPATARGGPDGPGAAGPRGGRGRGRGGVRTREVTVEVVAENPQQDAGQLLRAFMKRAYRRPVEEAHVQRFLALFKDQFGKGFGFARSMLTTYTAVLCSPGFIFIDERPGRLDDYALASRLSYFLWNSEPDEVLRARAARGELHRPEVLRAETERLLNDPKSRRFVEAFTDYWLDLRKIDDTSPSATLYNDYELDDPLKLAALEETRLFFAELVRNDLPVRDMVDSDFAFLNERLADHYGVPGVKGAKMRKVTLPKDTVRGGLMTQASVLKVTANGTTTSPVLRGRWITERILGYEIPPPPPVPSVEPDIRGAVTLRQQLEKHRNDASCATCHSKMDPPGFALESFDVMGGWRDRYRAVKEDVPPEKGIGMNGQAFAFYYALPVDCAGELPDGRKFKDIREFKRLLLQDEVPLARNLTRQLAVYATGAPLRFSDREQIERIVQSARERQYGVRSLVQGIVQSELFETK
jgi:mono/diheme cytochrome c family protein